jgi:presequence protease
LTFTTHRDPRTISSFTAFNTSIESICKGNFDENDIYEAKLQVFQSLDAPKVPRRKIDDYFFFGITDESKQRLRDVIFKADKLNLKQVCERHLLNKLFPQIIIGPKNKIHKEIEKKWKIIE